MMKHYLALNVDGKIKISINLVFLLAQVFFMKKKKCEVKR